MTPSASPRSGLQTTPPLSVVIAALEEAPRLPALLADLATAPELVREVLVVDGGSTDGTAQLAALAGARVLHGPRGRGPQLCHGLARCSGSWLLLLHADGRLLRLLELAVRLRSRWRQLPYGDQGLLVPRSLLEQAGGMPELALMEDLLLIQRLRAITRVRSLQRPLQVDGRRWQRHGVIGTAWRNAQLRRAWRRGISADQLARKYYGAT